MKATGVVRRVDDLGRIVIPKEIRRTLRIRDGESLEIFVDREMIALKKFSKMSNMEDVSKQLADIFNNAINSAKEETSQAVSNSITSTVINIISFIAVFIITRIILIFLHIFSEAIGNLPLIKQFNHIGGLLYGILKAFIIIFIVLAIIL